MDSTVPKVTDWRAGEKRWSCTPTRQLIANWSFRYHQVGMPPLLPLYRRNLLLRKVVSARVLCAECSERLSQALQRSLVARLGRKSGGVGEESSRSDSGPISGYQERRAHYYQRYWCKNSLGRACL